MRIEGFDGIVSLRADISALQAVDFDRICDDNMTEIFNRGKENFGETGHGTPVDSGELRISLSKEGYGRDAEVGYSREYAPHVEYGHRTVNGGYVEGQHFLEKNVAEQQPIFEQDIRNAIKGR